MKRIISMTMSKTSLLIFACVLVLSFGKLHAQEKTIVHLLNSQLQKELKLYPGEDSLVILQPFKINEKHELTVTFKRLNVQTGENEISTETVQLGKIKSLVKDINVLFVTEGDAVGFVFSTIGKDGKETSSKTGVSDSFYTEINKDKNNEVFRDKLIAAFQKAGYKVECTIWAD
ncbi:MAG: hypothetical protein Q7T76_07800 [Ferruginibacter sp.]|nr:hypothetical protein [Ferruginibacter sp.]